MTNEAARQVLTTNETKVHSGVFNDKPVSATGSLTNGHTRVPSAMGVTAVSPLTSSSTVLISSQERFTPPDNSSPSLPGHSPKTSASPHTHVSPLAGPHHTSSAPTSSSPPVSLNSLNGSSMNGLHPSSLSSSYYSMMSPRLQHHPAPLQSRANNTTSPRHSATSPHFSNPSPHHSNPSPHHSNPSPHLSNPSPHVSNPSPHHSNPSPHQSTTNTPRPASMDPVSPVIPRSLRMRNVIESLMSADVIRRHLEEDSTTPSNDPPRQPIANQTSSSTTSHNQLPPQAYTQTSDVPGYQKALDAVFAKRSQAQHRASIAGHLPDSNINQISVKRRNSHDVNLESRLKPTSVTNGFKERFNNDIKCSNQSSRSPTDYQMALQANHVKQYANHSPQQHRQAQNSPQHLQHVPNHYIQANHSSSQHTSQPLPPHHIQQNQQSHHQSQPPQHHPSQPHPNHLPQSMPNHSNQALPQHPSSQPSHHNQSMNSQPPPSLLQTSKPTSAPQFSHHQQQPPPQPRGSQLNQQQHHQIWIQQQLLMKQNEAVRNAEIQQKYASGPNIQSRPSISEVYRRAGYDSSPTNNYAIPYDQLQYSQAPPSGTTYPHDTVVNHQRSPPISNAVPPPLIVVKGEIPLDLSMKSTNITAITTTTTNTTSSSSPSTNSTAQSLAPSVNGGSRVPETSPSLLAAYQNAPKPQQFSGNQQMEQNLASAKYRALYAQPKLSKNEQKVNKVIQYPVQHFNALIQWTIKIICILSILFIMNDLHNY